MEKRQFIKVPSTQSNGASVPEQPLPDKPLPPPQQNQGYRQFSAAGIVNLNPPMQQQVAQNADAVFFTNGTMPQGFMTPGRQVPPGQSQAGNIPDAPIFNPAGPISPHQSAVGVNLFAPTNAPQQRGPQWSQSGITPLMNPSGSASFHQSQAGIPLQGTAPRQTGRLAAGYNVQPLPPWGNAALKRVKKRRFPIWARVLVAIVAVLVVAGGSAFTYYQVNYAASINHITGQQAYHLNSGKKEDGTVKQAAVDNTNNVLNGGRINILLLGSDTDGKNGNDIVTGTPLAQTDMIITIDPQTRYVGMLSIPRDLQVYIPGYTQGDKVDKAFMDGVGGGGSGAVARRVGYGAGLAEDTIQANFGIKINYYAWVDIYGFAKVVDTAGGVDIDAIHPIVDNSYPDEMNKKDANAYKRLYIAPGPQHMNGQQALEYVRTRHADLVGDIGRTARQQQLLGALKQKLANPDVIAESSQLLKDMVGSLFTDLQANQIIQIANYARNVDLNKVDRVTLGPPTYAYASPNPQSSNLLPYCEPIKGKIAQMFGLGSQANCIGQTASNASSGSTVMASARPQPVSSTSASIDTSFAQAGQLLKQALPDVVMSLSNSNTRSDSIHSLLDLLFLIVFQSFDALQI